LRAVEEAQDLILQSLLYKDINSRPKELNIVLHHGTDLRIQSYFRHHYFGAFDTACTEVERRFQQGGGTIAAGAPEKLFLDAANEQKTVYDFPEEIRRYFKGINLQHLQVQLQMLPDLIKTFNRMY
jgi:hypothetical protein